MMVNENLYKDKNLKLVKILFYIFPITFIIGNLALSLNLLLFLIFSLFLIKRKKLKLRFKKLYWILVVFFLYLFLLTVVQFEGVFEAFNSSLEGYGYNKDKLERLPFKDHPIFKSFLLFRFLILVFVIDILFFNKILNLKKFFFISLICTSFVSVDIIIQNTIGTDLLGLKNQGGRNSGPFGDELIAGGYLLKFSFLSFFLIYEIFKNKKFGKLMPILFISINALAIGLAGNRMPFFLFLFGCSFIILFLKRFRAITALGLIIFIPFFYISVKNNDSTKHQYLKFFQEINNFTIKAGNKIVKINNSLSGEKFKIKILDKVGIGSSEFVENILKKGGGKLASGHAGIWRTSIQMWKEQPIFGYGLKSFRYKCRDVVSKAGNSNIITTLKTTPHMHYFNCSNHSHNYYLEFLSETGLIGTVLIVLFFILILKDSFYYIKKYNNYFSSELILLMPIILTVFLEIWPLRSTGSFFSTWNATGFWIFVALLLASKKDEKINFYSKY